MSNHTILKHSLLKHKLALLRDKRTGTKEFRALVEEISTILTSEATRDLKTKEVSITTPFGDSSDEMLEKDIGIVVILRAGLGMLPGVLKVIPDVHVSHFGICRDEETLEPIKYYEKYLTDMQQRNVIVIDPILATGGTACKVIDLLKKNGAKSIKLLCIISSKQGVEMIEKYHPDIAIYTAAIDPVLDENGYIKPGLGDAGDRLYGTKD